MNHCPVSRKAISPPVTHPSAWCSAAIDALPASPKAAQSHLPLIDPQTLVPELVVVLQKGPLKG